MLGSGLGSMAIVLASGLGFAVGVEVKKMLLEERGGVAVTILMALGFSEEAQMDRN